MTTLKEGLKKASEKMQNPCFVCEGNTRAWGFGLELIATKGQAVKVYDCPEGYRPDCENDYPLEQWIVARVDPDGYIWPLDGRLAVREAQEFLWDAFTDADATGVELDDLLTWPGLHLTQAQIFSVESHYDRPEEWTEEDEEVQDTIADATDSEDFGQLLDWLEWTVGEQTAADLVESWENED